jgi:hypothetical protein
MKWLSAQEAEKLSGYGDKEPQAYLFACGHGDLSTRLPVPPRFISTGEGVALPTNEWVALIGDRPVVIQQELSCDHREPNPVTVLTPFADGPARTEWSPLRELAALPDPIKPTRPLFIQSRSTSREHVVFRPNERGWDEAIYHAAERAEAEDLLNYLRADPWNARCFIGSAERSGEWTIFAPDGRESRVLGAYAEVSAALRVASRISSDRPNDVLVVRDVSERRSMNEYRLSRGHLERALHRV